jgi:hypothetical protein
LAKSIVPIQPLVDRSPLVVDSGTFRDDDGGFEPQKDCMMTLHLVKLCVGADSIEDLASWQAGRLKALKKEKKQPRLFHTTFQTPKRTADLLDGGSLYWVIKGIIQARQQLVGFEDGFKDDGSPCCLILLDTPIVPVRPTPRRPFQGWRYLDAKDAPKDLKSGVRDDLSAMTPKMRKELAELGLI